MSEESEPVEQEQPSTQSADGADAATADAADVESNKGPPAPQAAASSSSAGAATAEDDEDGGDGGGGGGGGGGNDDAEVREVSAELGKTSLEFNFNFSGEAGDDDDDDDSDSSDDDSSSDDDGEGGDDGGMGDEDEDDMMVMMPPYMVQRVEKLRELNEQRDAVMVSYLKERAALEKKYSALCRPLYDRRREIVNGDLDKAIAQLAPPLSLSKVEEGEEMDPDAEGDAEGGGEGEEEDRVPGVPQFWICAMGHIETVAELITEQDVDCLEHCVDVTCDDHEDGMGFTLKFHFKPNDYFTNDVLTKTYEIPNLLLEDEPILKVVTGCEIDWKPHRCLTHREVQKRQRSKSGRKAGQIRTVTRMERKDSFFHFFNPPKMPSLDDMDEEQAEALEEAFDHDYDVAQAFRSHLIPKAVMWFTGEAMEEDVESEAEGETGED